MSQSSLPRKVEPYIVLATINNVDLANRMCAALEMVNIPVLIEHLDDFEDGERIQNYKLLAPPTVKELALRIVNAHMARYQTRLLVTARAESYN